MIDRRRLCITTPDHVIGLMGEFLKTIHGAQAFWFAYTVPQFAYWLVENAPFDGFMPTDDDIIIDSPVGGDEEGT